MGRGAEKWGTLQEKSPICLSCSCLFPSLSHTLENTLLHVDALWMNLTGIKMLHTNQPHLLKNEILSNQQELDRQLQIFQALIDLVDMCSGFHNFSRETES